MLQDYFGFQTHTRAIPRTQRSIKSKSKLKSIPRTERRSQDYSIIKILQKSDIQPSITDGIFKPVLKSKSQKHFIRDKAYLQKPKRTFIIQKVNKDQSINVLNGLLPQKKYKKVKIKGKNLFRPRGNTQRFNRQKNNIKNKQAGQRQNNNQSMLLSSANNYPLQIKNPQHLKKISLKKNSEEEQDPYGLAIKIQSLRQPQQAPIQSNIMIKTQSIIKDNGYSIPPIQSRINELNISSKSLIDALKDQIKAVEAQQPISELYLSSRRQQPQYSISIDDNNSMLLQSGYSSSMYQPKLKFYRDSSYQKILDEYQNEISSIVAMQKKANLEQSSVRQVVGKIVFVKQQIKKNQIASQQLTISQPKSFSLQYPYSMLQLLRKKDSQQIGIVMTKIRNHLQKLQQIIQYVNQSKEIYEDKSLQGCQLQNFLLHKLYYQQRYNAQLSLSNPQNMWVFILPNAQLSIDLFKKYKQFPEVKQLLSNIKDQNHKIEEMHTNQLNAYQTQLSTNNFTKNDKRILLKELHEQYLILNNNLESSSIQQQEKDIVWMIHTRLFNLMQLVVLISFLQNSGLHSFGYRQPSSQQEFQAYQNQYEPIVKQIFLDHI